MKRKRLFNLLVLVAIIAALLVVTPVFAESERDCGSSTTEYTENGIKYTSVDEWCVNSAGNSEKIQQNQKSSGSFTVTDIDSGTILYESFYDARSHVGISSNGSYNVESTEGSLKWMWVFDKNGEIKMEHIWVDGGKIN